MELILELKEEEVYPGRVRGVYSKIRQSVRVVLFDEDGNVALGYIPPCGPKPGWYSMIGGGIDEGETIEQALTREALEETGCRLKDVRELGFIKELGIQGKKGDPFAQDNYCFIASVDGEKGEPQFTPEDIADGILLVWLPLDVAIQKLKEQGDGFIKQKTLFLLEKAKEVRAS